MILTIVATRIMKSTCADAHQVTLKRISRKNLPALGHDKVHEYSDRRGTVVVDQLETPKYSRAETRVIPHPIIIKTGR